MGWFSDLFGTRDDVIDASVYTRPAPNGTIYVTSTGTSVSPLQNAQGGLGLSGGQQAMKGMARAYNGVSSTSMQAAYVVNAIRTYLDLTGYELHHVSLAGDIETNDPKVSVLKLAEANEVVEGVGVRTGKYDYYVIRKKE